MSRPRSDERRNAILAAAARVIAVDGVGATTASIAKEAGVSNGSLFLYFDTKATLINQLYVQLKTQMGAAAVDGLPVDRDLRVQFEHMWNGWLQWATMYPEKRRTLAQLDVSDDVTEQSHTIVHDALSGIAKLLEQGRARGPMKDASLDFVLTITSAVADATIDSMLSDPANAAAHRTISFNALWRMLA